MTTCASETALTGMCVDSDICAVMEGTAPSDCKNAAVAGNETEIQDVWTILDESGFVYGDTTIRASSREDAFSDASVAARINMDVERLNEVEEIKEVGGGCATPQGSLLPVDGLESGQEVGVRVLDPFEFDAIFGGTVTVKYDGNKEESTVVVFRFPGGIVLEVREKHTQIIFC